MKNTKNKILLVTGGTGLIGQSIIEEFNKINYTVIFTYLNNIISAKQIKKKYDNCYSYKLDISKTISIENLVKKIKLNFGRIDVLINNAGINKPEDFNKIKEKDWDKILNINLKGPFLLLQKTTELLKNSKYPSVINISSVSGQYGGPRTAHYAVSKAGLISLSQVYSRYASQFNIRCNSIAAGIIESKMANNAISNPNVKKQISNILLKKLGSPRDIANSCIFLSSEKSGYITGQTINVNGGLYF